MIGYTVPGNGEILTIHDWVKYEESLGVDIKYFENTLGYQKAVLNKNIRLEKKAFVIEFRRIPLVMKLLRWIYKV